MDDKKRSILNRIEIIAAVVYAFVWVMAMSLRLGSDSFWEDEGFTIWLSRMSIPDMLTATGNDVHPPLYYLFVRFFVTVFGESPVAFRVTSILAYALIVLLALTIIRKLWNTGGAVLLITLLSLLRNSSVLATEARMYELALLLVLVAFLSARMIMSDGSYKYCIIYGIAVSGAAYTHYYALVTVAIMSGSLLLYVLIFDREKLKVVLITEVLAVMSYCPWAIVLYRTFRNYKDDYWIQSIPSFGKCMREIFRSNMYLEYIMLAVTVVSIIAVFVIFRKEISAQKAEMSWICIGVLSAVGTALAGITVSLIFRPLFYERYMYPSAIIVWVILIYCLSRFKYGQVIAYALAVIIFLSCIRTFLYRVDLENSWDASNDKVRDWIAEETEGSPTVIFEPEATTDKLLMYYLPGLDYVDTDHLTDLNSIDEESIIYISSGADQELTKKLTEGDRYRTESVMEDCVLGETVTDIYILRYSSH